MHHSPCKKILDQDIQFHFSTKWLTITNKMFLMAYLQAGVFKALFFFLIFQIGVEGTKSKSLCCLCCRSGPISAFVRIPRIGFASGQTIQISGEIDNKTNTAMRRSFAQLVQVKHFSRKRSKIKKKTFSRIVEVAAVLENLI